MSVPFKTISSLNPRDLTLPNKYDPKVFYSDDMHFDVLMVLIIHVFTLIYLWVAGVLGRFMEVSPLQVPLGTQVKLSVLGVLYLSLSETRQETAAAVSSADSTKASKPFRPGRTLEKVASGLDVEKVVDPSIAAASTTAVSTVGTASQLSG